MSHALSRARIVAITLTDKANLTSLQASNRGLSLSLNYLNHGVAFSDRGLFGTVINLLLYAAQLDPKNNPSVTLYGYNQAENYTLSIGPTSAAASDRLPWGLLIPALGYLPSEMLGERPGGRWAELSGTIRLDGAFIGRIQIARGSNLPDSCGKTAPDSSIGMIGDGSSGNVA